MYNSRGFIDGEYSRTISPSRTTAAHEERDVPSMGAYSFVTPSTSFQIKRSKTGNVCRIDNFDYELSVRK